MTDFLTDDEQEALDLTAQLANKMRKMIGGGPQAHHDWAEAAHHIHTIQHMIMAQAAARAYPERFRLLGEGISSRLVSPESRPQASQPPAADPG